MECNKDYLLGIEQYNNLYFESWSNLTAVHYELILLSKFIIFQSIRYILCAPNQHREKQYRVCRRGAMNGVVEALVSGAGMQRFACRLCQ